MIDFFGRSIWHALLVGQIVAFAFLWFDQLVLGRHVFW